MANNSYSRYGVFKVNGVLISIPSIPIPTSSEDAFIEYDINKTRLDRVSAQYYNDDSYWWIIMMANPEYYFEFDIPYGAIIRVPLPLGTVLTSFQNEALKYV